MQRKLNTVVLRYLFNGIYMHVVNDCLSVGAQFLKACFDRIVVNVCISFCVFFPKFCTMFLSEIKTVIILYMYLGILRKCLYAWVTLKFPLTSHPTQLFPHRTSSLPQGLSHRLEISTPNESQASLQTGNDLDTEDEDKVAVKMQRYEDKIGTLMSEVGTLKSEVRV